VLYPAEDCLLPADQYLALVTVQATKFLPVGAEKNRNATVPSRIIWSLCPCFQAASFISFVATHASKRSCFSARAE
ncbi:unnamed protein product, partial [Mycena citricolor]